MRRVLLSLSIAVLVLAAAGCGSSNDKSSSSSSSSGYGSKPAPSKSTAAASLKTAKGKLGTFLTDGKGLTLYMFEKDAGGKSACSGACAKVWTPLTTQGAPKGASGLQAGLLSTATRSDGSKQVTYGGHPLYHYDDDHKPGQTEGQDSHEFGAGWYVVAPSGKKVENGAS
jgi:predicted lipoprotein with Yx(FWY)xxD motif